MYDNPRKAPTTELLSGLIADARDLVGGHAEVIRDDLAAGLAELKRTLQFLAVATVGAAIAVQLILAAAIAALVEVGIPAWLAIGGAAVVLIVVAIIFIVLTRGASRKTAAVAEAAKQEAEAIGTDTRWAMERAAAAVTDTPPITDGRQP